MSNFLSVLWHVREISGVFLYGLIQDANTALIIIMSWVVVVCFFAWVVCFCDVFCVPVRYLFGCWGEVVLVMQFNVLALAFLPRHFCLSLSRLHLAFLLCLAPLQLQSFPCHRKIFSFCFHSALVAIAFKTPQGSKNAHVKHYSMIDHLG